MYIRSKKTMASAVGLMLALATAFNTTGSVSVKAEENSVSLSPGIDTFVYAGKPDISFLQKEYLEVGQGREIYMQFDLRGIDGYIENAELYLSSSWTNSIVDIHKVEDDNWTSEITYNTKPSYNENKESSFYIGRENNVANITGLVKGEEQGDGIVSFAIINTYDNRPIIASSRSSTETDRPYLQITLTENKDAADVAATKYSLLRGVDFNNITDNLTLATTGVNGTEVRWTSSNENFVSTDGKVCRPTWFVGAQDITLTAYVSKGAVNDTATFELVLPATERGDIATFSGGNDVMFGDTESEAKHNMEQLWAERMIGAYGEAGRKIMRGGGIAVTFKCDPTQQNYLTAKFYGEKLENEGSSGVILADENGNNLNAVNGYRNFMFGTGHPFENRFIFSTYIIPKTLTEGKDSITLLLKGENNNDSRCIYEAYCHTGEFPDIDISKMPGEPAPIAPVPQYPDIEAQYSHKEWLTYQANQVVRYYMNDQIFGTLEGTSVDEKILEGKLPACLRGCVPKNYNWNYEIFIKNKNKTFTHEELIKIIYPKTLAQNLTQYNAAEIFALAYVGDWFEFESEAEKEEMLQRVLAMLDFACVAQGENGGFFVPEYVWIGGPNRIGARGNPLEGFGQQALARAFELVYEDAEAKGLLDILIDDDCDDVLVESEDGNYFQEGATPRIKRRKAYERLFKMGRYYLTEVNPGHAPNQDYSDIVAALHYDNSLELLGSRETWNDATRMFYLNRIVGEENCKYTLSRWMSPKGTVLEANGSWQGSYSGDYGALAIRDVGRAAEIAAIMGHEEYGEYALRAWDTIGHFMTVGNTDGSNPVPYSRTDGVITWRNDAYPGIGRCVLDYYSAVKLKSPMALRSAQLYFDLNHIYSTNLTTAYRQAHGADAILDSIQLLLNYDELYEAVEESRQYNYRFKGETEEEFFFSDEVARTIAFRNKGELMYMSMHWRHIGGQTNDIARLHFTTRHTDHVASISIESPEGLDGYYVARYKNYLMIMNSSGKNYTGLDFGNYITVAPGMTIKELSGSENADLSNVDLAAWTTLVFAVEKKYPFTIDEGYVTKQSEYNKDALLVKVRYEDGRPIEIHTEEIPEELNIGETVKFNMEEGAKYFILNSLTDIEPLSEAYIINEEVNE